MASTQTKSPTIFEANILGHKAGLFVLFFTEMWERFSFYGMRVLLVNFLTMALIGYNPGWEWSVENAGALFGTYAGMLYLTPILGGMIADKYIGYRWSVIIGALLMTLGHASMALETELSLYLGLGLLILGTGFFKPTMTAIISEMYKDVPEKKDGAFTIYYMGVNAGAFFGMLLCGYLAEKIGWSYGFGLAGVFMLLGTIQFWLSKPLFGKIGDPPKKGAPEDVNPAVSIENEPVSEDILDTPLSVDSNEPKRNPFTLVDKVLTAVTSIIGLAYLINDPMSAIAGIDLFPFTVGTVSGQNVIVSIGLLLFLYLTVSRILRYDIKVRDRMFAFIIFAFFTIFFWMSFEQGATSLVIFARDSVDRVLVGDSATIYNIINAALIIVPLAIITWVLYLLWKKTFKQIPYSNMVLVVCFAGLWGLAIWMLNRDFNTFSYNVEYSYYLGEPVMDEETGEQVKNDEGELQFVHVPISETMKVPADKEILMAKIDIGDPAKLKAGQDIFIIHMDNAKEKFGYIHGEKLEQCRNNPNVSENDNGVVPAKVVQINDKQVTVTTSWFSILNSFFIIAFASFFSKWWESKYNPSATTKYALGLIIMAIGFGLLAWGASGAVGDAKVSMVWLVLAYLFHTLGELCISPVGLSYVSKLVPARMIAFMFGMYYLAIAIGNKLAAKLGGQIENITAEYSLSTFFLIFTIVPASMGVIIYFLGPAIKKLMHGIK
ncbi:MAG: peptide MFS transporter [Flavobacteriales bacterium]|nr:peptide MFS transporter [Flavobacteriales bacterium]